MIKKLFTGMKPRRIRVPTVFQLEHCECGPASLAMMLAYFGRNVPLERLRLECGVSARDGTKAANLIKVAKKYGLNAKGYHMGKDAVKKQNFPIMIHWKFNHFIILEGYENGIFYLRDSSVGAFTAEEEEFDRHFTGVVIELSKGPFFEKGQEENNVLSGLKHFINIDKSTVLLLTLTTMPLLFFEVLVPLFLWHFIDHFLSPQNHDSLTILIIGILVTAGLCLLSFLVHKNFLWKIERKTLAKKTSNCFKQMIKLPLQYFSYRNNVGSRLHVIEEITSFIFVQLAETAINILILAAYIIILFYCQPNFAFIAIMLFTANLLYMLWSLNQNLDMAKLAAKENSAFGGSAYYEIQVIESLKAMGAEDSSFHRWSRLQAKAANDGQKVEQNSISLKIACSSFSYLAIILLVLLGGSYLMEGLITAGMFAAAQLSMLLGFSKIREISHTLTKVRLLKNHLEIYHDVINHPEDGYFFKQQLTNSCEDYSLKGKIVIKDLSFGYNPFDPPLIDSLSINIKPGLQVGLVGGSGSGKSTLAKIIAGLYQPWSGDLNIDDLPFNKIPAQVLTKSLALVNQEPKLFTDSIMANLTLWESEIDEITVIQAAKAACIHEDILSLPGGYSALLEAAGMNLSGGQRQRLEIAQALVKNPSIIILDEATSALDAETEQTIYDNIRARGCTCLIIAHRVSAIRNCDLILVLDKGKIVQRGTPEELIKKGYLTF